MNPAQANVTALAFVGDAVYELYIRNMICSDLSLGGNADLMHKKAIRYVRAESQANLLSVQEIIRRPTGAGALEPLNISLRLLLKHLLDFYMQTVMRSAYWQSCQRR